MKKLLLLIVIFLSSYSAIAQKTLFTPTEWSDPNNEFYNKVSNTRKYESTNFVVYWGDKVGTNPAAYADATLRFTQNRLQIRLRLALNATLPICIL